MLSLHDIDQSVEGHMREAQYGVDCNRDREDTSTSIESLSDDESDRGENHPKMPDRRDVHVREDRRQALHGGVHLWDIHVGRIDIRQSATRETIGPL